MKEKYTELIETMYKFEGHIEEKEKREENSIETVLQRCMIKIIEAAHQKHK